MPSQTVYLFRPTAAQSAAIAPNTYVVTENVVSIADSPAFSRNVEADLPETNPDGLGCVRAVRAAFILEGGLGLLIYAIWRVFRLVHLGH